MYVPLGKLKAFSYWDVNNLWNGVYEAPHIIWDGLLHVPSIVLYFLLKHLSWLQLKFILLCEMQPERLPNVSNWDVVSKSS